MKKFLAIILALATIIAMVSGCSSDVPNDLKRKKPIVKFEQDEAPVKAAAEPEMPSVEVNVEAESSEETSLIDVSEDFEPEDNAVPVDNMAEICETVNTIAFSINGNRYYLGMTCEEILEDFTVIEIDGCRREDGTIPAFDKIVITLADENNNQFIIVVRNDNFDKAVALEKCILHEVLVEAVNVGDMSMLSIMDSVDGGAALEEWKTTLGNEYSEYEGDTWVTYSWEAAYHCWVDTCLSVNTNEVEYVQLMTY